MKRIGNKGVAVVWIVILIAIFVTIQLYNIFSLVLAGEGGVFPTVKTFLNESNDTLAPKALQTIGYMETVWMYWPLIFIFGLLLWGIVSAQKKEPLTYGY